MSSGVGTAEAMKNAVGDAGAAFMLAPETTEFGTARGYADLVQFYLGGRCGVLGDVDPAVLVAGFGFLAPGAAAKAWPGVLAVGPARRGAEYYAQACAAYGRAKLAGLSETDATRLGDLLERVLDAAPLTGLALFAGWQAMPRPTDPRERAMHLIHVTREWRGSVHVACVAAEGIHPLDAIMLNGGVRYAEFFGWSQPYGDGHGREADMAEAERATSAACGSVIDSALSDTEQAELVALAKKAADLITAT